MAYQRRWIPILSLYIFTLAAHASFIESSMGAAVVNDATAAYYNPAALTLLKNAQVIALDSLSHSESNFSGQVLQPATNTLQSGHATTTGSYNLPSLYVGVPISKQVTAGFAVVGNDFNRGTEDHSITRFVLANKNVQDIDFIPALGFKINSWLAIGAALNATSAHFTLEPISGASGLNIPDSQSRNESRGTSLGGDVGVLITPKKGTLIGFNYRSAVTYPLHGISTLYSTPNIATPNYHFKFWTPARSVFSVNHFVTEYLGFVGTVQYIQWDIFKTVNVFNIATQIGSNAVILPYVQSQYHFQNAWLATLGTIYRFSPTWVVRVAGSYNESPSNGNYQIDTGDSYIIGASVGYQLSKNFIIDGSYAHAFMPNALINIVSRQNIVSGQNSGAMDAVSLKLTLNMS